MAVDPNIALAYRQPTFADPMEQYGKAMSLKNLMLQGDVTQQTLNDNRALNEVYAGAVGPDGKVDRTKVLTSAAQRNLGSKIPGLQKSFVEQDRAEAELADKKAGTAKTTQEIILNGLKATDNAIASLLVDPKVDELKVMSALGRLAATGAFNFQAQAAGMSPDDYARSLVKSMPTGNPQALRNWLLQAGASVMDASKRVELSLPKYDEQDRGGQINEGTINQLTGVRTPGRTIDKTMTPGEAGKNANESTQIVESADGTMYVVGKSSAQARPVVKQGVGAPVETKDSPIVKHRKIITNIKTGIDMARTALNAGPTASGAGVMIDKMMAFTGNSTKGADLAAGLKTLSGWLTTNVPRMEGPQSNADMVTYQQMAAMIGDDTQPISRRLQALDVLEQMMNKYSTGVGVPGPNAPTAPTTPGKGNPAVDINSFFLKS